ncbi:MAG: FecR domain-containing protein [Verrucomicrobiales bacterium]|nr:FecR domain-containing protein [Verrucomicrobiales bacterium]
MDTDQNTPFEFDREELLRIIGELFDEDSLSDRDQEKLNFWIKHHPEAREIYRDLSELHARLHLDYSGGSAPEAMPGERTTQAIPQRRSRIVPLSLSVAAVVACLLAVSAIWRMTPQNDEDRLTSGGVAVLSRSLGVEWAAPEEYHREGETLTPGRFRIASGLAQIEFFYGASVILEGPAELEIVSASRARIISGRLRASVPEPARGFTIEGPDFQAVDLGTEFAMSLDSQGRSEIHVIDGEVALHEKDGAILEKLTTGRAARIGEDASLWESIESDGSDFVDREQLLHMTGERGESGYTGWRRSRLKYIDDPDTLVYFDFEDQAPWDRQLRNARSAGPHAAIIGARWVTGRWSGKGALEIKRVSDRIRLDIPGEFKSLSFLTWVRIEGLEKRFNSLFLTDSWDVGESHWHIGREGQLTFGIKDIGTLNSKPALGPGDLGRWLHLAAVYDAGSGVIHLYRDGELVSSSAPFPKKLPLRLGPSEIGNWQSREDGALRLRTFNGRFDEFLISRRPFSSDEVREHYEGGNPYR